MKIIKKEEDNRLGYSGLVEVGLLKNGKKYKLFSQNAGTYNLFEYLGECLIGTNVDQHIADRPGNLIIMNDDNRILSYGIHFNDITTSRVNNNTTDDYNDNSSFSVIYGFIIPGTIIYQKKINRFKLAGISSLDTIYASTKLDEDINIQDMDTNVYVTWNLTIRNSKKD